MPGPLTGNDPGTTVGAPPRVWREVLPGTSRRGFLAAVGAGSLAALLAACAPGDTKSGGSKPNGPAKRGGTLRDGTPPPPTFVDPVTAYDGSAVAIIQLVADYLVWLDKDFGLQPRLATEWTSDKDAKKWTFTANYAQPWPTRRDSLQRRAGSRSPPGRTCPGRRRGPAVAPETRPARSPGR
ncbi:hypothetical protein CG723_31580 [Streptomyces sp. CB01635]|uniref:twin-arginine translocation signal domain-containing protein n=1 Tax=unclassified Streptomyces TaxID=2593676 RepID=UPI000C27DB1B|nr:twin-arginine translocation signal domain-containing protein [Streptomyces sp. CB01635]PJN07919.1 hypothetical protein CG723_31580 [Streptomyces sp. CB01635]